LDKTILITNDDSIFSSGIKALEDCLKDFGTVYVVAPDREKSAISFALTTNEPLRIEKVDELHYAVTGTPVDCVYLATKVIIKKKPDLVVSGINHGANLGEDTIYSGTVGGAFQASLLGFQSIAVSAIENEKREYDFNYASKIIRSVSKYLLENPLGEGKILSINVPYNPKGARITKLGHKRYDAEVVKKIDPRGGEYFWIGAGRISTFGREDSDVNAIENNYVSITPLSLDFSNNNLFDKLKNAENEIFKDLE